MRRPGLLVLPALVPIVLVLGAAVVMGAAQSLGLTPLVGEPHLSADAYTVSAGSGDVWQAVGVSLAVASAATAIAIVVGFATALAVTSTRRGGRVLASLAAATIPVPHIIGAAAVGLLLADSGWLPRILGADAGSWPQLVAGPWWGAVVLEYAWKESAFIALVIVTSIAADADELSDTAAVLGAGPASRIRHVIVPIAAPGVIVGGAISFIYALGSFEVPWLLGRAYPEPLPVLAYRLFTSTDLTARPQALAVAMLTVAMSATIGALALALLRRRTVLA